MIELSTWKILGAVAGALAVGLTVFAQFWPRTASIPPVGISADLQKIIDAAAELVKTRRDAAVTPEHLLVALLEMPPALTPGLADSDERANLRERLRSTLKSGVWKPELQMPIYTDGAFKVLVATTQLAFQRQLDEAGPEELLAAILRDRKSGAARALVDSGVSQGTAAGSIER